MFRYLPISRLLFQSTLSMRRATGGRHQTTGGVPISIHALHEESDTCFFPFLRMCWISIHALHEESDRLDEHVADKDMISIHALHEESDSCNACMIFRLTFQSTLSMRRAT